MLPVRIETLLDDEPESGNVSEDSGSSLASSGAERNDADDVVKALSVFADERTTGISHASRPFTGLAETDHVWERMVYIIGVVFIIRDILNNFVFNKGKDGVLSVVFVKPDV